MQLAQALQHAGAAGALCIRVWWARLALRLPRRVLVLVQAARVAGAVQRVVAEAARGAWVAHVQHARVAEVAVAVVKVGAPCIARVDDVEGDPDVLARSVGRVRELAALARDVGGDEVRSGGRRGTGGTS